MERTVVGHSLSNSKGLRQQIFVQNLKMYVMTVIVRVELFLVFHRVLSRLAADINDLVFCYQIHMITLHLRATNLQL